MKTGKANFHKKEKWQQQYNQHTRSQKEMHRGQSVREQVHVKKKWEPAIVKQKTDSTQHCILRRLGSIESDNQDG
ncbi:hypothetical protein LSAT2_026129 [Lamellibrachia satsuma]|nr:hypothetical protein LSAT2_026129 [Lamellibrachia satsuma]